MKKGLRRIRFLLCSLSYTVGTIALMKKGLRLFPAMDRTIHMPPRVGTIALMKKGLVSRTALEPRYD